MAAMMDSRDQEAKEQVCMLFTDIEGSTRLLQTDGEAYPRILSRHFALLEDAIQGSNGEKIQTVGDAIFAVFPDGSRGVQAAITAQQALETEKWPHGKSLKVRMGLHKGLIQRYESNLVGIEVHRAARIGAAAHGGQIIISKNVRDEIQDRSFRPKVEIRDLGFHRLKDLRYPESLYDIAIPGLSTEFAPISTIGANRTNLPFDRAPFFGREREIEDVKRKLQTDQKRLVTLVGPGGAGKTSLALAIGQDLIESFARGVFLVQLGGVSSEDLVASTICQALNIQESVGVSATETIKNTIGDAQILIVLDTFEHLIDATDIVVDLLSGCPNLSFLITSRRSLGVQTESAVVVKPLATPSESASYNAIAKSPSVDLFVQLAQREASDFTLGKKNAKAIATLCRRLDGLPLALSLAASHIGLLEPSELAGKLQSYLTDLRGSAVGADPRHRTLRSLIKWSDDLLNEQERQIFYSLSVFTGSFSVKAAEFVLGEDSDQISHVADLRALISHSLLERSNSLGQARLNMLDTIREYAREGLKNCNLDDDCNQRHALYYTKLANEFAPHVMNADQREYVEGLFLESGNIHAAINWLLRQPSATQTVQLLSALKWFWITRGLFSEARKWTDAALEQVRRIDEEPSLAAILDLAGWIRYLSGDVAGALMMCSESYEVYEQLDDQSGLASAGIIAGIAKAVSGNAEEGGPLIVKSLELFRSLGDDYGVVIALLAIGEGARAEGDEVTAEEHHLEAFGLLQSIGNTFWQGHLLQNFAHFRLHQGDWKAAREKAAAALELGEEYDYPMVVSLAVAAMSGVALASAGAEKAAHIIGAVEARLFKIGAEFEHTDSADFQKIKDATRTELGEKKYERMRVEGANTLWENILEVVHEI